MLLNLEQVARRIKDLEDFMSGSESTELTVDTLDRISKVLQVKALEKKENALLDAMQRNWQQMVSSALQS